MEIPRMGCHQRRRCIICSAGLTSLGRGYSDRSGGSGERCDESCGRRGVEFEVVVAATQILDEGVPGDHRLRGPVGV